MADFEVCASIDSFLQ